MRADGTAGDGAVVLARRDVRAPHVGDDDDDGARVDVARDARGVDAPRGARIRDAKARIRDATAVDADSRRATTRGRGRRAIERARRRRRR